VGLDAALSYAALLRGALEESGMVLEIAQFDIKPAMEEAFEAG